MIEVKPFFHDNKCVIACSCSNEYVPYLSVYIKSVMEHVNESKFYDIVVLETDIDDINKDKITKMNTYKNISIRFCNVASIFDGIKLHIQYNYFAKQCYYRLAAGQIFRNYEKVFFTDIDIIINFDVADIFYVDMHNKPLAAVKEVLWTQQNRIGKKLTTGMDISNYIENVVKTKEYYNTGVLLIDIHKFNKLADFNKLIQIATSNKFINQEQDVINLFFSKKITTLSWIYNFEVLSWVWGGTNPTYNVYQKYLPSAKIYHFCTGFKVWFYPNMKQAQIWWKYARMTPFYEDIVRRMVIFSTQKDSQTIILSKNDIMNSQSNVVSALRAEFAKVHFPNINNRFGAGEYNAKLSFVMNHLLHFRLKKFGYALKKAFAFGERYAKYNDKYQKTKQLIKDAKKLKKSYYKV